MFLHPWAIILGIAAVGLPVAVHWLTKPRPVRLPLSTLRFVREAVRQRRARHRLRDFVVLALRTCAVLCVALAVARPKFGEQPLVSDAHQGSTVRVVIVDVSQSMAAVSRSAAAIERARTIAAGHLRYRPGLRANLIFAGAQPHPVFSLPSQNFEALRDELQRVNVRPDRLDINRAIGMAGEMLVLESPNDSQRRELVIVSDFQRSNWTRADFSPLPQQTQIQFESTSSGDVPPNLALLRTETTGRTHAGAAVQLEVEIGNYSPTPQQPTVEVTIGDATFRVSGNCPAGRRTTLVQEIQLKQRGWLAGQSRLVGVDDALPADNARGVVVEVSGSPTYALVTRQGASQIPSSSYFLERALVPDSHLGERSSGRVVRINPTEIDREKLASADLIVIDHPGKISPDFMNLLAGLLRRGRPVLYLASESVDAANLQLLSSAAGSGLQMPVAFAPPAQNESRRNLFLASVRKDDAPFDVFGENTSAILGRFRFAGGLSSRRLENTLDDDVLATYSDGSACLVLTSSDKGTLAVLNADLNNSNLPTGEAFVPFLDQLVERLLQRPRSAGDSISGEPLVARLPAGLGVASELKVVGPEPANVSVSDRKGDLLDEGVGVVWRWTAPDVTGVYRIQRAEQTVFALPINLPDEESQLEPLAADVLQNRLTRGLAVHYRSADSATNERDVLWAWILVGCVSCVIGESLALIAFRS